MTSSLDLTSITRIGDFAETPMNKIPRWRTTWLRPIGIPLIALLAPALPALASVIVVTPIPEPPPTPHYIYEGQELSFQWSAFKAIDGTIVGEPIFLDVRRDDEGFRLSAPAKAMGRDRVWIEPWSTTGAMDPIPIDVWVYPRIFPISGRFDDGRRTVGLFDAENGRFQLCRAQPGQVLDCGYFPVVGYQGELRLPVAWPRAEDDDLALFSPESGTFYVYKIKPDGTLKLEESVEMKEAVAAWPVWGAFDPGGDWQLALVHADGTVTAYSKGNAEVWREKLEVPERNMLVWPAPWPIEDGSLHALALFQPAQGHVHWSARHPDGSILAGYVHSTQSGDFSRPVLVDADSIGSFVGNTYFLHRQGNRFELRPFNTGGRPNVIPIKFPDDPPGGPGGEEPPSTE